MAKVIALALFTAVVWFMPYGSVAQAQIDVNIHWGPQTWAQNCQSDNYGHFWGKHPQNNMACWQNRHYASNYHKDQWGRW